MEGGVVQGEVGALQGWICIAKAPTSSRFTDPVSQLTSYVQVTHVVLHRALVLPQ